MIRTKIQNGSKQHPVTSFRPSPVASRHNRQHTQRTRQLRQTQTLYEDILWRLLRDRRLEGYKFRRQHPIGRFTADVAYVSSKLIIELDGNSHDEQMEQAAARDQFLKAEGWNTLRVRNCDLMTNGEGVILTTLSLLKT